MDIRGNPGVLQGPPNGFTIADNSPILGTETIRGHRLVLRALIVVFSAVVLATPASAQTADFLFGSPAGAVGIRTGWMTASADSDLFDFVQDEWTIERSDFDAPAFGVDLDF